MKLDIILAEDLHPCDSKQSEWYRLALRFNAAALTRSGDDLIQIYIRDTRGAVVLNFIESLKAAGYKVVNDITYTDCLFVSVPITGLNIIKKAEASTTMWNLPNLSDLEFVGFVREGTDTQAWHIYLTPNWTLLAVGGGNKRSIITLCSGMGVAAAREYLGISQEPAPANIQKIPEEVL